MPLARRGSAAASAVSSATATARARARGAAVVVVVAGRIGVVVPDGGRVAGQARAGRQRRALPLSLRALSAATVAAGAGVAAAAGCRGLVVSNSLIASRHLAIADEEHARANAAVAAGGRDARPEKRECLAQASPSARTFQASSRSIAASLTPQA